jgi:RNA polymerase sigma-70 factor (ECF subfamily)
MTELQNLAGAALNGSPERLEELLEKSAGLVHALARARLGDTLAADEASAEALFRAARGIRTLKDPVAYPRWIARITARAAADTRKRSKAALTTERLSQVADSSAGPADLAAAGDRARAVRNAVAGLPRRVREPLLLHFSEGLPYRQIAEVLGVGLGTVARRVSRGLTGLKRALGEEP